MNDTQKYFQAKCYNGISVRLQNIKIYHLASLVPLPGTLILGSDVKGC
jgi:hypothetical protein